MNKDTAFPEKITIRMRLIRDRVTNKSPVGSIRQGFTRFVTEKMLLCSGFPPHKGQPAETQGQEQDGGRFGYGIGVRAGTVVLGEEDSR